MKKCGFINCNRPITEEMPGAEVGYMLDEKTHKVHVCSHCAFEIMRSTRGTLKIVRGPQLVLNI